MTDSFEKSSKQVALPPEVDSGRELLVDLVNRHYRSLFAYAYRLSGNVNDAEDVVQQAVMVAQQNISQLRDPLAAQGWMFRILRNCFLKGLRKRQPLPAGDVELDIDLVAGEPPDDEVFDKEELQVALYELPAEYRVVIVMFFFEDLSYKQIAAELEIPIGTVMSRLSRAKNHLRRRLATSRIS